MSDNKWQNLKEKSQSSYLEEFKAGFLNHIAGSIESRSDLSNLPRNVLNRAKEQRSLGALSRIFDEFKYSVPPYEEIPKDKAGLMTHIQSNLDELLPLLLNKNKDGLSEEVINAIGQEEYKALTMIASASGDTKREIAKQFIASIITSYGQRMIDQYPNDKQHEVFNSIAPRLQDIANKVDLSGIPQEIREEAQNRVEPVNQQQAEMNLLLEKLNEFSKLIQEIKQSGIKIGSGEVESAIATAKENAGFDFLALDMRMGLVQESYDNALIHYKRFVQEQIHTGMEKLNTLTNLVAEVEQAGLNIGSDIQKNIDDAKQLLQNESEPLVSRLKNVESAYKDIVHDIRDNMKKIQLETPEEVNCIIKLLRFITGNEKLFQQEDEKRYEQKIELDGKIEAISESVKPIDDNTPAPESGSPSPG